MVTAINEMKYVHTTQATSISSRRGHGLIKYAQSSLQERVDSTIPTFWDSIVGLSFSTISVVMQVLKLSQFLLLQTAADDAIIRLRKSTLSHEEIKCLTSWYFKHQYHTSIGEFLQYECSHNREVFMQVEPTIYVIPHLAAVISHAYISSGHYSLSTDDPWRVIHGN